MPRQNYAKALAAQQRHNGVGPIYAYLTRRELEADARFGNVGGMRRPDHLLRALRAGEPVQVSVSRIPVELRPPDCGPRLVVTMDM